MSFPSVSITDTWPGLVLCPLLPSDCFQADPSHHNVHIETVSKYLWISLEGTALLSIVLVVFYEEPPAFPLSWSVRHVLVLLHSVTAAVRENLLVLPQGALCIHDSSQ